jgi:hypothetical protein
VSPRAEVFWSFAWKEFSAFVIITFRPYNIVAVTINRKNKTTHVTLRKKSNALKLRFKIRRRKRSGGSNITQLAKRNDAAAAEAITVGFINHH